MWKKPKTADSGVNPSDTKGSEQDSTPPDDPQLSAEDGVKSDVSSVALSRGVARSRHAGIDRAA